MEQLAPYVNIMYLKLKPLQNKKQLCSTRRSEKCL